MLAQPLSQLNLKSTVNNLAENALRSTGSLDIIFKLIEEVLKLRFTKSALSEARYDQVKLGL